MSGPARRAVLGAALHGATGLTMVVVGAMVGLGAGAGAAQAQPVGAWPEGEYTLTRRYIRPLSDGNRIVTTRRWRVRFAPEGTGARLTGRELDYAVAAPERLAVLAEAERKRARAPFLPIGLDARGRVIDTPPHGETSLDEMVAATRAYFQQHYGSAEIPAQARGFIAAVERGMGHVFTRPPADLLFPMTGTRHAARDIVHPGGAAGTVTVETVAHAAPDTGMMRDYRRTFVTRLDDVRREAIEEWETAPAGV